MRAPVKVVEKLFDTKLYVFKHAKQSVEIIRQLGPYSLPVSVAEYVGIVSSLSDFPMIDVRPKVTFGNQGIVPQVLEAQYNIPSDASASGTSQGVIEFGAGQYFSPSSLATFSKKVDIPITPLTQSHIIAPAPPVGVEGTLDIQYISTTGKGSTNWYWTDKTWLYDWSAKFSSASDKPEIVSISYGWSELAQCEIAGDECQVLGVDSEQYVARVNTEFQKIGVQGVSLLCASGDSGANGRTDPDCTADKLRPAFPAASPYITAVGATQLVNPSTPLSKDPPICTDGGFSCKSGGQETAVSFNEASFASGGGFSNFAPQPSYQTAAVAAYLNSTVKMPPASYFNASNRGFPDVASLGHAILIYSSSMGGVAAVGGTSASSPSFAGYMSLLNQVSKEKTNGKSLGFLNPLLYKMAADQPDTFTDITVGDNICTGEHRCCCSLVFVVLCACLWFLRLTHSLSFVVQSRVAVHRARASSVLLAGTPSLAWVLPTSPT